MTTISARARPEASTGSLFEDLYSEHARPIFNVILRSVGDRQLAEDVCQDVWVKVYRGLPGLRDPAAARAWVYRIAEHACVDAARRRSARPGSEELEDWLVAGGENPAAAAVLRDDVRLAWQALATLPARQHMALFLREVDGRSYRDIAALLDTTEGAVETLLFRARRALAQARDAVEGSREERCRRAMQLVALLDGETTPVQRQAIEAHLQECEPCNAELREMRKTSTLVRGIGLVPLPASLAAPAFQVAQLSLSGAGSFTLGKAMLSLCAKAKLLGAVVPTGGVAATILVGPGGVPVDGDLLSKGGTLPDLGAVMRIQDAGSAGTIGSAGDEAAPTQAASASGRGSSSRASPSVPLPPSFATIRLRPLLIAQDPVPPVEVSSVLVPPSPEPTAPPPPPAGFTPYDQYSAFAGAPVPAVPAVTNEPGDSPAVEPEAAPEAIDVPLPIDVALDVGADQGELGASVGLGLGSPSTLGIDTDVALGLGVATDPGLDAGVGLQLGVLDRTLSVEAEVEVGRGELLDVDLEIDVARSSDTGSELGGIGGDSGHGLGERGWGGRDGGRSEWNGPSDQSSSFGSWRD